MNASLADTDPEVFDIIEKEKQRQRESIVLIPSENFTSAAVMSALGSVMQNKYSEGYPNARYYGGNEFIDQAELLCQKRALDLYNLDPAKWGVNVQALSGAPANLYVYNALMKPHERLMGLDLPHGGHLSHGFQTDTKKISAISSYFESMPYRVREDTGLIDFEMLQKTAALYRPKVLIAGASAYARNWEYGKMKEVADSVGAYLMADIAHLSGLIGAGVVPHPFDHADVVTTTTHKSLRGPRGAMIFFRKGVRSVDKKGKEIRYDLENAINASVFPGHQGGPHNHTITALTVALKQAKTPEFKAYQVQVLKNAKAMENAFRAIGFELRILELVNLTANKNTMPDDKSALIPYGLRVGSPAMTTRGLVEKDFETVVGFVIKATEIAIALKPQAGGTKFKDFKDFIGDGSKFPEIVALKKEVIEFSKTFPTIGFEESSLRYK
ncbi:serine hydroxymethyltransferase-domain-containing protein [Chytriomyces sp. MP71]|nr:serine hydroxymethyltransferase-domain-containing protein [Chytriomyces sp. MP71]